MRASSVYRLCVRYLLGLHVLSDAYVGQQLPLQNLSRVLDTSSLGYPHSGATLANEIQGHLHRHGVSWIANFERSTFSIGRRERCQMDTIFVLT